MTPSLSGRTAMMLPGVRPIIRLASTPTATIWPVLVFRATTDGSFSTMPRPRTYTSVFAVPRSTAMSRPRKAIALLIRNKNLPAGSWQVDLQFSRASRGAALRSTWPRRARLNGAEIKRLALAPICLAPIAEASAAWPGPGAPRDVQRTAAAMVPQRGEPFWLNHSLTTAVQPLASSDGQCAVRMTGGAKPTGQAGGPTGQGTPHTAPDRALATRLSSDLEFRGRTPRSGRPA